MLDLASLSLPFSFSLVEIYFMGILSFFLSFLLSFVLFVFSFLLHGVAYECGSVFLFFFSSHVIYGFGDVVMVVCSVGGLGGSGRTRRTTCTPVDGDNHPFFFLPRDQKYISKNNRENTHEIKLYDTYHSDVFSGE